MILRGILTLDSSNEVLFELSPGLLMHLNRQYCETQFASTFSSYFRGIFLGKALNMNGSELGMVIPLIQLIHLYVGGKAARNYVTAK